MVRIRAVALGEGSDGTSRHVPRRSRGILLRSGRAAISALLGMALVLYSVTAVLPAQASVTNADGTLTGYAGCNSYYHQMGMSGTFRLSDRFPSGTWVASRYAYWQVDGSTGQRVGEFYYTWMKLSWARPGTIRLPETELGGPETVSQNSDLPTVTINDQQGRLNVAVQVAVLDGWAWDEWSPYDVVTSYPTSNQYGFLAYNSMCVGSVT